MLRIFLIPIALLCLEFTTLAQKASYQIRTTSFFGLPFDVGIDDSITKVYKELDKKGVSYYQNSNGPHPSRMELTRVIVNWSENSIYQHGGIIELLFYNDSLVGYSNVHFTEGIRDSYESQAMKLNQTGFEVVRVGGPYNGVLCECHGYQSGVPEDMVWAWKGDPYYLNDLVIFSPTGGGFQLTVVKDGDVLKYFGEGSQNHDSVYNILKKLLRCSLYWLWDSDKHRDLLEKVKGLYNGLDFSCG